MKKENVRILCGGILLALMLAPLFAVVFETEVQKSYGRLNPELELRRLEDAAGLQPTYGNYITLAIANAKNGRQEQGRAVLEKAKAKNPGTAVAYNNLGVACSALNRIEESIAAWGRAVEIDPSFQLAKNNLSWGLAEKEKLRGKLKPGPEEKPNR